MVTCKPSSLSLQATITAQLSTINSTTRRSTRKSTPHCHCERAAQPFKVWVWASGFFPWRGCLPLVAMAHKRSLWTCTQQGISSSVLKGDNHVPSPRTRRDQAS
eukprot:6112317-Amphidinium_carterae.1